MTHFNRIKHATNVEIDAALRKMRVNDIQKMNTGPLGMDWQDTTAIPQ